MAKPFKPEDINLFQAYIPNYRTKAVPNFEYGAGVYANKPSEVIYDPFLVKEVPNLFGHEFEHQLNRKAGKRYGEDFDVVPTRPEYMYWRENLKKFKVNPNDAEENLAFAVQSNAPYIAKLYKEKTGVELSPKSRIFSATGEPLSEILAELSSIESAVKMDFTKDPVLREKLFGKLNTEAMAQTYRSVTGGRQDRLDAKDLPPYTTQKQDRTIADFFKDLKFSNPFGDTTKD